MTCKIWKDQRPLLGPHTTPSVSQTIGAEYSGIAIIWQNILLNLKLTNIIIKGCVTK